MPTPQNPSGKTPNPDDATGNPESQRTTGETQTDGAQKVQQERSKHADPNNQPKAGNTPRPPSA